jgi:hypothetical protein
MDSHIIMYRFVPFSIGAPNRVTQVINPVDAGVPSFSKWVSLRLFDLVDGESRMFEAVNFTVRCMVHDFK